MYFPLNSINNSDLKNLATNILLVIKYRENQCLLIFNENLKDE